MAQCPESRGERVDLASLIGLGDADEEVVRAFGEVAREREAARDVVLGGEAAEKTHGLYGRANEFLVCVTETNKRADIDALVDGLKQSCQ